MNKPLLKTFQNINGNTTVQFGVCKCYKSGDFCLSTGEKSYFAKMAFKDMNLSE